MMNAHLVVDVSGHGFGHLGQIAPVLREMLRRIPGLRLTLRTAVAAEAVTRILRAPYQHHAPAAEAIPLMRGPNRVDVPATAAAFAAFHANFAATVETEARRLEVLRPTLLVSDIPYSSLAAASAAGIPAVAFSSLNWRDVVSAYCSSEPGFDSILDEMKAAYAGAGTFILCAPHLPTAWHPRRRPVGPVGSVGRDRRDEILRRLGTGPEARLVLVSYGGIPGGFPVQRLPTLEDVRWIFGELSVGGRGDGVSFADLGMPFADVVRSVDLALTKPGYGLFADAACNGTPVLYVERPDWPETPYLAEWIARSGAAASVPAERLLAGDVAAEVLAILDRPRPRPVEPSGIAEAADILEGLLRRC